MATTTNFESAANVIQFISGQIGKSFGPFGQAYSMALTGQVGVVTSLSDLLFKIENGTATSLDFADVAYDVAALSVGFAGVVGFTSPLVFGVMAVAGLGLFIAHNYPEMAHIAKEFGDYISNIQDEYATTLTTMSPLILDLDGTGVQTTKTFMQNVYFDHDANGFAQLTSWVNRDDGLLVFDKNHNGKIDNGNELFGNQTKLNNGSYAKNGFEALADLDSNKDAKIDYSDVLFNELRVWKDTNSDGVTDAGELLTLAQAGIRSIGVNYLSNAVVDNNDNENRLQGQYTKTDGSIAQVDDIWFAQDLARTVAVNTVIVTDDVKALPNIQGFGNVMSLHQTMMVNSSLKNLVQNYVNMANAGTSVKSLNVIAQDILYQWVGVNSISVNRGEFILDARHLSVLETFMGQAFVQSAGTNEGTPNPGPNAAEKIENGYSELLSYVQIQLASATYLKPALDGIKFTWNNSVNELLIDVSQTASILKEQYDKNHAEGIAKTLMFGEYLADSNILGVRILAELRAYANTSSYEFNQYLLTLTSNTERLRQLGLGYVDTSIIKGTADNDEVRGSSASEQILGGAGNDYLYGDAGADLLIGEAGDDFIYGGIGNDILSGGIGNDRLDGQVGNDFYLIQRGEGFDYIIGNRTEDSLIIDGIQKFSDINFGYTGSDKDLKIQFGSLVSDNAVVITNQFATNSSAGIKSIQISNLGVFSVGGLTAGNDLFFGGSGDDDISGGDGDDILFGKSGNDTLKGGNGHNYYYVSYGDFSSGTYKDYSGNDTIVGNRFSDELSIFSPYVNSNIDLESAVISGQNSLIVKHMIFVEGVASPYYKENNRIVVLNQFADISTVDLVASGVKSLTFNNGSTMQFFSIGTSANDELFDQYNQYGASYIYGGDGHDLIHTSSGIDMLDGGKGDDVFSIDNFSTSENRAIVIDFGDGNDKIKLSRTLFPSIYGSPNNTLSESQFRIGALALDADDYVIYNKDTRILYYDEDGNGANKQIVIGYFYKDYSNFEAANITFQSFIIDNTIVGTGGNDVLLGGNAADMLIGGNGDDVLKGDAGNDTLDGGEGNDYLYGGTGDDHLRGGAGQDTYRYNNYDNYDFVNAQREDGDKLILGSNISLDWLSFERYSGTQYDNMDIVVRSSAGAETGRVVVVNQYATYNGISGVSQIQLEGFYNRTFNLTVASKDTAGDDLVAGTQGNDYLFGGAGNDVLVGGFGNDTLHGGAGDDQLNGGAGQDTYRYNNYDNYDFVNAQREDGDKLILGSNISLDNLSFERYSGAQYDNMDIVVRSSAGIETGRVVVVNQYATYNGISGVSQIQLEGFGNRIFNLAVAGKQTDIDDLVAGTQGNDTLSGSLGNDVLVGGFGNDDFLFHTALGSTNVDTIADFAIGQDMIKLDSAVFTKFKSLNKGALNNSNFAFGKAKDADDFIVYNQSNGYLYYDEDGVGAMQAILFADLADNLALTAAQLVVI